MFVVDIETKDPYLNASSPHRTEGFITGVAIKDLNTGSTGYYEPTSQYVSDVLKSSEPKIFHNCLYDIPWLKFRYGHIVNGRIWDTMVREALCDPTAKTYKLDVCCKKRGIAGKATEIEDWWKERGMKGNVKEHMDEVPFKVQAEYAIQDVNATGQLFLAQKPPEKIDLIESDLIPVIVRMLGNGVRIDEAKRDAVMRDWQDRLGELEDDLTVKYGICNISQTSQIARFFHEEGIKSPGLTATGGESWDKRALDAIDHPVAEMIIKARSMKTVLRTFLEGGLQQTVNGRLYTSFFQTGRDEGGTITGRFSSANPNLQNIPSADDKGGTELRSLFIPEDGCLLGAFDYKQIEYRLLAHYAIKLQCPGYEKLRKAMWDGVDYHAMVSDMLGWGSDMRKIVKTLNFGVVYGMGKNTMKVVYRKHFKPPVGQSLESYVDWVFDTYFNKMTFVRPTCQQIQNRAKNTGFVISVGGRKHETEYGKEYKSVNKLIQGSAADILKIGLVNAEKAGVWDVLKLHLTVHDENVFSCPRTTRGKEAMEELVKCMMTEEELEVPLPVDTEVGPDWGHCSVEGFNDF